MKKLKVAIVGNGARSTVYANAYATSPEIEVVAIADPSIESSRTMCSLSGLPFDSVHYFADWRELDAQFPDLDGVAVVTPNYLHRQTVMTFLRRRIPVALEKPFTTTMEDAEAILDTIREYDCRVLLGFVLRSTPYYSKIHELISTGRIGRVLTVQADELASYGVTSVISRSPWRRYSKMSGGIMMEKSSHDIDLINWLIGSKPVAVNSFGGSLLFRPNPLLPDKCGKCPHSGCHYRNPEFNPQAGDAVLQLFMRKEADRCIYNIDKDVFDNQSVAIQYANGSIANFMLSFHCAGPHSNRNFHAIGTRGRIWGNIDENRILLYDNLSEEVESFVPEKGKGGHNGGDANHALELLKMMKEPSYRPAQDAYAGYLSGAVCIAADLSAIEGCQIRFRYGSNEYITFH